MSKLKYEKFEEAVRRQAEEIRKACEQERWRLKVCWAPATGGAEVQLGLLWSEDLAGLEALKRNLEEGG